MLARNKGMLSSTEGPNRVGHLVCHEMHRAEAAERHMLCDPGLQGTPSRFGCSLPGTASLSWDV